MRESKIRKDLEEAKTFREEAEKKLKAYKDLMESAKVDAKKILSEYSGANNYILQLKSTYALYKSKTLTRSQADYIINNTFGNKYRKDKFMWEGK